MDKRAMEIVEPTKGRRGRSKSYVNSKVKTHHSCLECPKVFVKFGQLLTHRRRVHSIQSTTMGARGGQSKLSEISGTAKSPLKSMFRCHGCKGLFSNRQQLSKHVQNCRKRPMKILRSCNTCNFKSADEKEFLLHIKNEHTLVKSVSKGMIRMVSQNSEIKGQRGPIVVPILKSKTLLFNSKDEKGGKNKVAVPFECNKCTQDGRCLEFKNEIERQRHCNEVHNVFHCHICHSPSDNGLQGLQKHLETKHSQDEKDLALGSVIVVDDAAKNVIQVEVDGVENIPNLSDRYCKEIVPQTVNPKKYKNLHRCIECKYMTYHGQNLVRHMNSFHTPYACPVCHRLCKGKKRAILHLRESHNMDGKEHFPLASHCSKAKSTLFSGEHLFRQETEEESEVPPSPKHMVYSIASPAHTAQIITYQSLSPSSESSNVANRPNVDAIMRQAFEKVMSERPTSGSCLTSVDKCCLLPTNENLAFWELQQC